MENEVKKKPYSTIAAILFIAVGISQFFYLCRIFNMFEYHSAGAYQLGLYIRINLTTIIVTILAYLAVIAALLRKKRDKFSAIAFALLAFVSFAALFSHWATGSILLRIFRFLTKLGLFFIVAVACTDYLPPLKPIAKQCWFIPAAIMALFAILTAFFYWGGSALTNLIEAAAMLFAAKWAVAEIVIEPVERKELSANSESTKPTTITATSSENEAYCGLVKHILLLLFTFGIWYLIWIYRMTGYLNCVEDEEPRNPTTKLLLCIFVPFYSIYWVYKSAQRIDKLAAAKGISSDLSTLCLILAIFVGIIPPILMQDKINAIVTADDAPIQQQTAAVQKSSKPDLGIAEELKTYKELLDSGVITQEEFDAKKKQLLGL